MPEGMYTLALEDTSLFRDYQKHAKVAFHIVNRDYTVQTYTLEGTTSLRNVYIGPVPTSTITNNEDTMWYDSVLFVSVATVLGVVMLASVAWLVYRRCVEWEYIVQWIWLSQLDTASNSNITLYTRQMMHMIFN